MHAVPNISTEKTFQLLDIGDGTTWKPDARGEDDYWALLNALNDVHLNTERALADYKTRVGPFKSQTENGTAYVTICNGEVKAEGQECKRAVLHPPFTAQRQIEQIIHLTGELVREIIRLRPDSGQCVVWRRSAAAERYLVEDGLAFSVSARMAWE